MGAKPESKEESEESVQSDPAAAEGVKRPERSEPSWVMRS